MFEAVPVPFGREEIDVALLAVLVWKASRLLNVAVDISPVMRWAVDEKVRLPVVIVALAADRFVMLRLLIVRLVSVRFVTVAEVALTFVSTALVEVKLVMMPVVASTLLNTKLPAAFS